MAGESSFPFVAFLDPEIVISPSEIHLGEQFSSLQFLGQLSDKRERVVVLDGVFVKIAIILYHSLLSVLFRDEEHRGCLGRFQRSNVPFSGLIVDEVGYFFLFLQ